MDTFNFSFFDEDKTASESDKPKSVAPKPILGFADDAFDNEDAPDAPVENDPLGFSSAASPSENFDPLDFSQDEAPSAAQTDALDLDFEGLDFAPAEMIEGSPSEPEISLIDANFSDAPLPMEPMKFDPLDDDFALDMPALEEPTSEEIALPVAQIEAIPDVLATEESENDVLAPVEAAAEFETIAPEMDLLELETPEMEAPEMEAPEMEAPEIEISQAEPLEMEAPTVDLDEMEAPATVAKPDPFADYQPPLAALKVAVLGASGIGKSHARWFAGHGCNVVGFLGSTNTSVVATEESLGALFGFKGQGFSDLEQLLDATQPEAVCIATPPEMHFAQIETCLQRGIHVLCEKPLVYAPNRPTRETLNAARDLVKLAAKKNLVFATQLQYGGATPILCKLAGVTHHEVGDFAMELETSNPKAPRDPKALWIELAPHPLSITQFLAGEGAQIIEETVQIVPQIATNSTAISVRFGVQCADGRLLMSRAILRTLDRQRDNREPRRRFAFNGRVVQYKRTRDNRAQYTTPDDYDTLYDDPVNYLIGNFARACRGQEDALISGDFGRQNLDWLLKLGAAL